MSGYVFRVSLLLVRNKPTFFRISNLIHIVGQPTHKVASSSLSACLFMWCYEKGYKMSNHLRGRVQQHPCCWNIPLWDELEFGRGMGALTLIFTPALLLGVIATFRCNIFMETAFIIEKNNYFPIIGSIMHACVTKLRINLNFGPWTPSGGRNYFSTVWIYHITRRKISTFLLCQLYAWYRQAHD